MKLLSFVFLMMVATSSFSQDTNFKILFEDVRTYNNVFALISLEELLDNDSNGFMILNINETDFVQIKADTCKSYLTGTEYMQLDTGSASYVRSYCDLNIIAKF